MYQFKVYVDGEWVCTIEPEGSYKQGYYAARREARSDRHYEKAACAVVICGGVVVYSVHI